MPPPNWEGVVSFHTWRRPHKFTVLFFVAYLILFLPGTAGATIHDEAYDDSGYCLSDSNPSSSALFDYADVIVLSSEGEGFVLEAGNRITITSGKSIRLLPGTHIKAGAELTASIVSKDYQEALAEEAAKEEKKKTISSIMDRYEPCNKPVMANLMIGAFRGSRTMAYLSQQMHVMAVLPVRTEVSSFKDFISFNSIFFQPNNTHLVSPAFAQPYLPYLSWGDRGETIAVMRT